MKNKEACSTCEEIYYDRCENAFVYRVETMEWDSYNDEPVSESILINYCFECGRPYCIEGIMQEIEGYIENGKGYEELARQLEDAYESWLNGISVALAERVDQLRYATERQNEKIKQRIREVENLIEQCYQRF